jgi:hypothetical protein
VTKNRDIVRKRPFFRKGARALALALALGLVAATQAACDPGPAGPLKVTAEEDLLGLSSRLIFSSAFNAATDPRFATLTNSGSTPINVTGLTISGAQANQFKLAAGQPTSFTIAPSGTAKVGVRFTPTFNGPKFASLTIANNSSGGNYTVLLRGMSARGTQGDVEPQLAQLMQVFGYTTNVGFTGVNQATTRAPVGDELAVPYFVRADSSKPVQLIPIARYVSANLDPVDTGRNPKNSGARQTLYRFPPDTFVDDTPDDHHDDSIYVENQKTFPKIGAGTTSFNPTDPFGIYGNFSNYTDDQFNRAVDEITGLPTNVTFRNVRSYPAKNELGQVMANTWILGVDVKTTPDKNYDYQDQVMLLVNARPEFGAASPPGAATNLSFTSPVSGTVVDKDGQGTGFLNTQVNKNNTQAKPSLIDLTGGTVRITSTVGKNSGAENLQDNALQVGYDGSRADVFVQTRLLNPGTDLTAGYQQKAIYLGPDQDNYFKIEMEHRIDKNGVFITALREAVGKTGTVGQVKVTNPASVTTLDLLIAADLETGGLQAMYRINSDTTWQKLGAPWYPTQVMRFFNPQERAGILVSHTQSTSAITGVYDSFSVS